MLRDSGTALPWALGVSSPLGRAGSRTGGSLVVHKGLPMAQRHRRQKRGACGEGFVVVSSLSQSCLTLLRPMDCSPPGFSIYGISHARILEWVAISFSRGSFQPRDGTLSLLHYSRILYH